jgi:hypothetical protein
MAKTVIGLVENRNEARKVVEELLQAGFRKREIGVIASDDVPAEFKAVAKDAGKGAAVGALTGLVLAATTMIVPGFGPLLVAGPAAALVAGLAYGGLAGGIIGTLISKGVPEDEAHAYAEGLRRGGTLVTVHAETDRLAQRAVEIMATHGALDIEERARQWKSEGWNGRFEEKRAGKEAAPVQLSAVEVYSMVIEMPERRLGQTLYSGEDRRQAA